MVCCMILFILIAASINKPLKSVKWNPLIAYVFFAAGLGIFAISFLHPIGDGYRAFSFILMFGFPCLYYVWNNRKDYDELYKRVAAGTSVAGILYFLYYCYIASNGDLLFLNGRVRVTFYDPNMFSMIGMIAVNSALYMLLVNRRNVAWFALTAFSLGTGSSIVYLGGSRLSMLVVAGSLFSFAVFYIKVRAELGNTKSIGLFLLKCAILVVSISLFVFVGNMMLSVNNVIVADRAAQEELLNSTDAGVEETQAQSTAEGEAAAEAPGDDNDDLIDRIITSTQETTADSFLSGRITLWRNYAKFLNLTGNDFSKTDWDVMNEGAPSARHAHNNFFELAYRCGVPVACIHILLELMAGIICLIWLFGRKYKEPYYLFCVISMSCYALESMFDIATLPFERPAPFYFYLAMIPIFTFGQNNSEDFQTDNSASV